MLILTSNGPIKVADLQKLASQLMLNDALMIEMVNNTFSESKKKLWSFDKARNVIIKTKIEIVRAVKNVSTISQDRKGVGGGGVGSKSFMKMLYCSKFLASECI